MKKNDILSLIYQLASPVAVILLGVVLFFSPDTASALIAKVLGWGILLAGIGIGVSCIFDRDKLVGKCIGVAVCVSLGSWLTRNPLVLAAGIGRVLGILLLLRGGRDLLKSHYKSGKVLSLITAVLGVVLIVLPMTTSRVVFSLCGLVMAVVGVGMLLERLKDRRYLNEGGSDIIDAE